jgi:hypothetical protein
MNKADFEAGTASFRLMGSSAIYRLNGKVILLQHSPEVLVFHGAIRSIKEDRVEISGQIVGIELKISLPFAMLEKL